MAKYRIVAERTLVEAWTYTVEADSEQEAVDRVTECPDGRCKGIIHHDDVTVYEDAVNYVSTRLLKQ